MRFTAKLALASAGLLLIGVYLMIFSPADPLISDAVAQEPATFSPVRALEERDVYYPGTEDLGPDEMRIIA